MMMRPVGVGFTSRGPIGVEGLTITAGSPVARDHLGDEILGDDLAALVGADRFGVRQVPGLVGEAAGAQVEGRDRAGVDDPLHARAQRLLHDDPACPRHWRAAMSSGEGAQSR